MCIQNNNKSYKQIDVNSKLLLKKENIKIIKADIIEDKEEYFVILILLSKKYKI